MTMANGEVLDTLVVQLRAELDTLRNNLKEAQQETARAGEAAGQAFGRNFDGSSGVGVGGSVDAQKGKLTNDAQQSGTAAGRAFGAAFRVQVSEAAQESSKVLAGVLAEVGVAAGAAGVGLVKLAGEAEQAQVAFTTLLGSAEKAQAFLADLRDFAARTPFEMAGLQDSARKLLAFGFTAQQIVPMLTAVGDAVGSLGGSAEVLDRVVYALGQIQAKGKVSAEEMMQLAETGIPAWRMLADQIGVSIPEAMKRAEDGMISAAAGIPALLQGMQEKFGGGMEAQSKTLLGMWSTTMDNLKAAGVQAGEAIIEAFNLKDALSGLNSALEQLPAMLDSLDLKQWARDNADAIAMVGGAITAALIPAAVAGATALAGFIAPLLPFMAAGAAIALVLRQMGVGLDDVRSAFAQAGRALDPLKDNLSGFMDDMRSRLLPAFRAVGEAAQSGFQAVQRVVQGVLMPALEGIAPYVQQALLAAGGAVRDFAEAARAGFQLVGRMVDEWFIPVWQKIWPVIQPILTAILQGVTNTLQLVGGVFRTVGQVMQGDWKGAWEGIVNTLGNFGERLTASLDGLAGKLIESGKKLGTYLWEGLQGALDGLQTLFLDAIANAIEALAPQLPGFLRGVAGNLAGSARTAADRNARDAASHYNNAGRVYGDNMPALAQILSGLGINGAPLTQRFGANPGKFGYGKNGHLGLDYGVGMGTALYAPFGGRLVMGNEPGGFGQWVKLIDAQGKQLILAHLSGISKELAAEIRRNGFVNVDRGQFVARSGNTGNSTGPHLHIELRDANGRVINPEQKVPMPGTPVLASDSGKAPVTETSKVTDSVPKPGWDFDYKSLFGANAAGTPKLDELKKYNLTLADWNKLQARAMELAREAAEAESDLTGKLRLQVDARVRAWAGESEARKQAFQLATTLVARQKQVDDGTAREARTQAEIRAQEKLEKAIRNASRARLEQLANGTVGENGLTLDKWNAARAELERRDRAEAESRRKNAAEEEKAAAESKRREKEQAQLRARIASERRQLTENAARQELERIQELNRQELAAFKGNGAERLALIKRQAEDEYQARLAVARATRDRLLRESAKQGGPNQAERDRQIRADYAQAELQARGQRDAAVRQAQEQQTETVRRLRDEYSKLAESIRAQVAAGEFGADQQREATARFNELGRAAKAAGLDTNQHIELARKSVWGLIAAGADLSTTLNLIASGVARVGENGELLYATDEELRGIGVAAEGTAEDFFDLKSAIDGVGMLARDELELLIAQAKAKLGADAANALRDAWERAFEGLTGGPIELPDNLAGRGVQNEPDAFDPATGNLAQGEAERLASALWGQPIEELKAAFAILSQKDTPLGNLLQGAIQAKELLSRLEIATDPVEIQGITAEIAEFMASDMGKALPPTISGALEDGVRDAKGYTDILGRITEGTIIDGWERATRNVTPLPTNEFTDWADKIFGLGRAGLADPTQKNALVESLQQARKESRLTEADLQNLLALIDELTREPEPATIGKAFDLPQWQKDIQELTDWFDSGTITAEQYTEGLHNAASELYEMAAAAEAAGNIPLAERFREQAVALRALNPEIARTLKTLGKVQEYAGYVQDLAGAFGQLADAAGNGDLAANLNGIGNLAGKVATLAGDVMRIIANPADIGAWVGAITKVISGIAEALGGFKKAHAEAKRLRDEFQDQNPLLNAEDYQKTFVRSRGFFADLFGGGPEVVNEIDKLGYLFAKTMQSSFVDGITNGLKEALAKNDFSLFSKTLKESVYDGILKGVVDAFINGELLKGIIAPAIKAWSDALKTPDTADDAAALAGIDAAINQVDQRASRFYSDVAPKLQGIGQKWGIDQSETRSGQNGALFGNAPGVQLGVPRIEVSLPTDTFKPLSDFAATIPRWEAITSRLETVLGGQAALSAQKISEVRLPEALLRPLSDLAAASPGFAAAVPIFASGAGELRQAVAEWRGFMRGSGSGGPPPLTGNGGLS